MQQRITKDVNEAQLEVEAGNMTKKAFKEQEMALMGELDELTEEFEHMKNLVNTLRV
jgi:predicted transcriptional regulator